MGKLTKYLKPFIWFIIGVIAFLFVQAITELSLPGYMSSIVNNGIAKANLQVIYSDGTRMILFVLLGAVSAVIVGFLSARVAAGFAKNIREKVFVKVQNFSNAEFDKFSTSSLITRATNDIQQVQMLIVMLLRIVFYAPILCVGGIIKILRTDLPMGWVIGAAIAAILVIVVIMFTVTVPKFRLVQMLVDKLNQVTREILTGVMVIRAFNTQKYEEDKFDDANKDLTKLNLFVNRMMAFMMPVMLFIMNGVTVLIVWVGARQIDAGNMQVGDMIAFMQYAMLIIFSFLMISIVFIMVPRAMVSANRLSEILETEPSIKDPENPEILKDRLKGYIEYKNVSFKYPGAEDYVLKNINFTAMPGRTTAFIGSTGCGKSTLVNLIPRFYDVSEGQITIDSTDIRAFKRADLRKNIGYIPQKGILFSGTIESNLKFADENATSQELEKAAEVSQSSDFINEFENKMLSAISQSGTNVSGGQRQRLSIARALIKKPQIFIFDDSFSALDFKTDAALRHALKDYTKDSTILIVAQRISTIMDADLIIVLDEGVIVGTGRHKDLLKTCEVYNEIALSQLSREELES